MKRKVNIDTITFQVLGTITDILLYYTFLLGSSIGKTGSRGVYRAFQEADEELLKCNHQTLASAWHKLLKNDFVRINNRKGIYNPEITKIGEKFLTQKIPTYQKNRPWDHKIYLITYDIAENHHKKRDLLRLFLRKIHCRRFQESVWLTPYNPRQFINKYISEKNIEGTIIVSDIGRDGGIGETTTESLLSELYNIERINDRYKAFLAGTHQKFKSPQKSIFEYLSILKDDPQLPFELLPKSWLGEKAYQAYEDLKHQYILLLPGRD